MRALTSWTVLCVEHYYRRLLWVTGMVSGQKSPTETVVHAEVRRQESGQSCTVDTTFTQKGLVRECRRLPVSIDHSGDEL